MNPATARLALVKPILLLLMVPSWVLVPLFTFSNISFAESGGCEVAVCPTFEKLIGRPLSVENRKDLDKLITLIESRDAVRVSRRLRTKTLLCLGLAYDTVYVGGGPFICSDFVGRKFGGLGIGAGFGAGISGSVFALVGRLFPGTDIVGSYSGGHASAAFGYYGAGGGILFRNGESGAFPDPRLREKLIWIGYEAGLNLEFSAMELAIWEWQ